MALNTAKCNHLMLLCFKGLTHSSHTAVAGMRVYLKIYSLQPVCVCVCPQVTETQWLVLASIMTVVSLSLVICRVSYMFGRSTHNSKSGLTKSTTWKRVSLLIL